MGDPDRSTVVVSEEGHILLPQEVRETLDWQPGTHLIVEHTPEGVRFRKAHPSAASTAEPSLNCCDLHDRSSRLTIWTPTSRRTSGAGENSDP